VVAGTAGASAAAEGDRRANRRVEDVRRKYGDHAAVVAEEMAAREAAGTWGRGSEGESRLANFVAREVGKAVIAIHDRLIPARAKCRPHLGGRHGVGVVDAKTYKGRLERRESGPFWRRENTVYVGGRNRGTERHSRRGSRSRSQR
jgi:hypothetical protein